MLIIGLTGGIGSGKTTVANYFAELSVPIIDADHIARILTQPGTLAYQAIIQHFGTSILTIEQQIDRIKLRDIIFNQPKQRKWLEALLHPLIQAEIKQQLQQVNTPYCLVVIPLLIEKNWQNLVQWILVVDTLEDLQRQRSKVRDQLSDEMIEKILLSQHPRAKRINAADDIIVNDKDLAHLRNQVERLHQQYLILANQYNN
jgi:dephospho-CoA kinase